MRITRSHLTTLAAVGAAAVGGGAIANAATSTTSSSSTTSASVTPSSSSSTPAPTNMPAHGSARHENAEQTVTGTAADQAKAAAVKAAGGGTATTVTSDYTHDGYEVEVKKTDGSTAEIRLDSSFNVQQHGPGHDGPGDGGPGISG